MTENKNRDFYRWTRDKQKVFEEQVKQANDTKYPISGGTIRGQVVIDMPPSQKGTERPIVFNAKFKETSNTYTWSIGISTIADLFYICWQNREMIAISPHLGLIPGTGRGKEFTLGYSGKHWPNVYADKLNNGEDIEIPTKGGTIALLSDIEDILKKYNLIPETKE